MSLTNNLFLRRRFFTTKMEEGDDVLVRGAHAEFSVKFGRAIEEDCIRMEEGVGYRMSADRWHQLASHTHKARSTIIIGDRHETAITSEYDMTTSRVTPSKESIIAIPSQ